ncbi:MAG: FlgD immunoglobulin-like domain containing protein, partial [Bacteroidota bacterium]
MKTFRIILLIGWGCLATLSLQAQKKVPHSFQFQAEAREEGELKELTQVSYSGTSSLRLYFDKVQLGPNSYLLLEGSDGAQQKMDSQALKNWRNSSAYFNGQSVKVSLYQAASEEAVVKLKEMKVNEKENNHKVSQVSLANTSQARMEDKQDISPWATAVGRFTDGTFVHGTGWIAANGAIVTDNRFGGRNFAASDAGGNSDLLEKYDIIEFNVPLSNPDGTVNHPSPEDQYPINTESELYRLIEGKTMGFYEGAIKIKTYDYDFGNQTRHVNGGYTIMEALPNSTGKRPGERLGQYFQVLRHNSGWVMNGMEMELFHYGRFDDGGIGNRTRQKVSVVLNDPNDWLKRVSDKDRFLVYNTPVLIEYFWDENMEGAPVVFPGSNIAVGIHSEGRETNDTPSLGTGFRDQDFRKHLGEFFTTAVTYVDQASVAGSGNGNIYEPYLTISEGSQQAADNDILNIARGSYNESVTINKPLKLSAPVGAVVIGAAGGSNSRTIQPTIPAALYGDDPSTAFAEEEDLLVEQSSLKSFPNPFVERTELHYTLTDDSPVQVKVYDMTGQEVHTLIQQEQAEGEHSVQWDGRNYQGKSMPTGLYIMQLKTGEETSAVRVM